MNRNKIIRIAMIVCGVLLAAAVVTGITGVFDAAAGRYENENMYSVGEAELSGRVNHLDIHWLSGRVNFAYHRENTVVLRETSGRPISEDMKLRWWLDGDTLRVQFSRSGLRLSRLFGIQEKELTLTLPEGMELGNVNVQATSADVNIPALKSDHLKTEVTSGSITAAGSAKKVSASLTSGNLSLRVSGNTDEISAHVTSGNITVDAEDTGSMDLSSTSGHIRVTARSNGSLKLHTTSGDVYADAGESGNMEIECTSGDVQAKAAKSGSVRIHTTSGTVKLALPRDPGFTAQIRTTSGNVEYSLPLSRQGTSYVCGDGSGSVDISTTSGNVTLEEALP